MDVTMPNTSQPCCFSTSFKGRITAVKGEGLTVSTEVCELEMFINSSTQFFRLKKSTNKDFDIFQSVEKMCLSDFCDWYVFGQMVIYPSFDSQKSQSNLCTELYLLEDNIKKLPYMSSEYWGDITRYLADWWKEHSVDDSEGGYFTNVNPNGKIDSSPDGRDKWTYIMSRTLYGFSTAFALTGDKSFLDAAKNGADFLFKHAFFKHNGYTLFHTRLDRYGNRHSNDPELLNIFTQIYGLTGLVTYYDITRCNHAAEVIDEILRSLDSLYYDRDKGGFYDAISAGNLKPVDGVTDSKSFNSIVDPLSAVLLYLSNTNFSSKHIDIKGWIVHLCELIVRYFVREENNFICEVFKRNWEFSKPNWYNQYNAPFESGNVGGSLKVIWVLLRAMDLLPETTREKASAGIAGLQRTMLSSGAWDAFRGGWFKYMKRNSPYGSMAQHMYHTHKLWWQQEEGIVSSLLAYLVTEDRQQLRLAADGMAFWLKNFVDNTNGGIFHTVSMDGIAIKSHKGGELKGGYHELELARYVHVYLSILNDKPVELFYAGKCSDNDLSCLSIPARVPGLSWQLIEKANNNGGVYSVQYKPIWTQQSSSKDINNDAKVRSIS